MADLAIEMSELRARAAALRGTCAKLRAVRSDAAEIAAVVGHDRLAGKVREFGEAWDITRGKIADQLEYLAKTFEAIDDTFTDLDNDLATELRRTAKR